MLVFFFACRSLFTSFQNFLLASFEFSKIVDSRKRTLKNIKTFCRIHVCKVRVLLAFPEFWKGEMNRRNLTGSCKVFFHIFLVVANGNDFVVIFCEIFRLDVS